MSAVTTPTSVAPLQADGLSVEYVYAFGDSYSDNGAQLLITQEAVAAKIPEATILPPPQLYWEGRWSNGPTAVEYLAKKLGVGITDYAVGGANSGDGNYHAWLDSFRDTSLHGQVRTFTESLSGKSANARALYFVAASANDYFQMVDFSRTETPDQLADHAVANTRYAVEQLVAAGARNIMVSKSYWLSNLPAVVADARMAVTATTFTRRYDDGLPIALAEIALHPGIKLTFFEFGHAMQQIAANAKQNGLSDVRSPCQVTMPRPAPACENPEAYMWWDEYHPTRHTHELLADAMAKILSSI
jgi:phospholipase/lecithinase/hemolysin